MKEYKSNLIAALICAAGVTINILLGAAVSAAGLPLYLDTIGTVVIAVLGGYLPGVIVGLATNIAGSINDPSMLYYGILNVGIAFFASFLSRKGWFNRPFGIFGATGIFALIGGGFGALIPWFMDDLSFDSEPLVELLCETGSFDRFSAYLAAGIIMDFPDKLLTVFIALIIIRLIPKKYNDYFKFAGWLQTPVPREQIRGKDRTSSRVISLKGKILMVLGVSLTAISIIAVAIGMSIYRKAIIKEHTRIAQGTAEIAAEVLDADRIDEYLKTRGRAAGYEETEKLLEKVLSSSMDIAYLYIYQISEDGCHVVFDVDTPGLEGDSPGTIIPFDEGFSEYVPDLLAGREVEPIILHDRFGYLLTVYKPVYDSNGRCVCYVGVDVDMEMMRVMQRSFFVEMLCVYLGFFVVFCILAVWLAEYHIIFPVNAITRSIDKFTYNGNDQESIDSDVRELRSINIHTGDEIEKLYDTLCRMTLNQTEQMRKIRTLSESTTKMQDGLIITMADLVENRDENTGAHIQKTAAYVKIIVEALKKKGYYEEKITPEFMSDVVRSAPLHDVGKINVPDAVLNKPGKLTDEEYSIMKSHAAVGGQILEKAIDTVEGGSYLREARNMAAYHHERWDGKGYPEGLHGEVIPLSARIMAVADVFDALTSSRVYKPGFPLEKALAIIEEGKGSQFDPKCVEAFMDSLNEVQMVLKKFKENE